MNDKSTFNTRERYIKWLSYYHERMGYFGTDYLFLIDDCSPPQSLPFDINFYRADDLPKTITPGISIFKFSSNLGRNSMASYPGWWRSYFFSLAIAKEYGFEKIIHIESDFFVTSKKLADYMVGVNNGWRSLFSQFYKFPETAIQIIANDSFPSMQAFSDQAKARNYLFFRDIAENLLPFSHVVQDFDGDRIGESTILESFIGGRHLPMPIDYIGQVRPKQKLKTFNKIFDFSI